MTTSTPLGESMKRMAATLLDMIQTRLELLSNEIDEERLHFRQVLLYASIALLFFGISIMLLTMFVVVVFWDSQRLLVLASLAGLFFIAGLLMWDALRRLTRKKSKLFSTSLGELNNDRDQLAHRS